MLESTTTFFHDPSVDLKYVVKILSGTEIKMQELMFEGISASLLFILQPQFQ